MRQRIKERMHALRMTLHPNSIEAFIIPSTDLTLVEYVMHPVGCHVNGFPVSRVRQEPLSSLMNEAGLWTDSRYFHQAAKGIEGSGITLYKEMLPGTPSITKYLSQKLKPG